MKTVPSKPNAVVGIGTWKFCIWQIITFSCDRYLIFAIFDALTYIDIHDLSNTSECFTVIAIEAEAEMKQKSCEMRDCIEKHVIVYFQNTVQFGVNDKKHIETERGVLMEFFYLCLPIQFYNNGLSLQ